MTPARIVVIDFWSSPSPSCSEWPWCSRGDGRCQRVRGVLMVQFVSGQSHRHMAAFVFPPFKTPSFVSGQLSRSLKTAASCFTQFADVFRWSFSASQGLAAVLSGLDLELSMFNPFAAACRASCHFLRDCEVFPIFCRCKGVKCHCHLSPSPPSPPLVPTLRAPLFGTFLQRKDVVNQCLEFALVPSYPHPYRPTPPPLSRLDSGLVCLLNVYL